MKRGNPFREVAVCSDIISEVAVCSDINSKIHVLSLSYIVVVSQELNSRSLRIFALDLFEHDNCLSFAVKFML